MYAGKMCDEHFVQKVTESQRLETHSGTRISANTGAAMMCRKVRWLPVPMLKNITNFYFDEHKI